MKKWNNYIFLLLMSLMVFGCNNVTNVTPDYIIDNQASFDNGYQTSGIWCSTFILSDKVAREIGENGLDQLYFYTIKYGPGYVVSVDFKNRYNGMIKDHNNSLDSAYGKMTLNFGIYRILKTDFYYITNQGMEKFLYLNDKRKLLHNLEDK